MASSVGQPNASLSCSIRAASHKCRTGSFREVQTRGPAPKKTKAPHVLLISV